jgi:hypothetical protein
VNLFFKGDFKFLPLQIIQLTQCIGGVPFFIRNPVYGNSASAKACIATSDEAKGIAPNFISLLSIVIGEFTI